MIDEKGVWSLVAWHHCCSEMVSARTRFARAPKKLIARVDMLGRDWLVRTRATGSDPRMDPTFYALQRAWRLGLKGRVYARQI